MPIEDGELRSELKRIETRMTDYAEAHSANHKVSNDRMTEFKQDLLRKFEQVNEVRSQINEERAIYEYRDHANQVSQNMNDHLDSVERSLEDRIRKLEELTQKISNTMLGANFQVAVDGRFRTIERLVWMAAGAVTMITIALKFVHL